jgi:hypothetical protein
MRWIAWLLVGLTGCSGVVSSGASKSGLTDAGHTDDAATSMSATPGRDAGARARDASLRDGSPPLALPANAIWGGRLKVFWVAAAGGVLAVTEPGAPTSPGVRADPQVVSYIEWQAR